MASIFDVKILHQRPNVGSHLGHHVSGGQFLGPSTGHVYMEILVAPDLFSIAIPALPLIMQWDTTTVFISKSLLYSTPYSSQFKGQKIRNVGVQAAGLEMVWKLAATQHLLATGKHCAGGFCISLP